MDDALKCTVYGYRQNSENLCSLSTTFAALFDLYSLVMALVTVSQKAFLLVFYPLWKLFLQIHITVWKAASFRSWLKTS